MMRTREPLRSHNTSGIAAPAGCHIHECRSPACGLRYPVPQSPSTVDDASAPSQPVVCARCGGPVSVSETPNSHPSAPVTGGPSPAIQMPEPAFRTQSAPLAGLLNNLRSAFNVGSIFRIADGAGFSHVHVCGISATPQQAKVRKTALGAESTTAWSYHANALHAAEQLRARGWWLVALETRPDAHTLFDAAHHIPPDRPLALMVGNEVCGMDPQLLALAHTVLTIPMLGQKESLNVAVAFGIAAYWLRGMHQPAPITDPASV